MRFKLLTPSKRRIARVILASAASTRSGPLLRARQASTRSTAPCTQCSPFSTAPVGSHDQQQVQRAHLCGQASHEIGRLRLALAAILLVRDPLVF